MHGECARLAKRRPPNAKSVADHFRATKRLAEAANGLRAIAMPRNGRGALACSFTKPKRRASLARRRGAPGKRCAGKPGGESRRCGEPIEHRLPLGAGLGNAYGCLRGLCRYMRAAQAFDEAAENIRFSAQKLGNRRCGALPKGAATYGKWEHPTAMGLARSEFGRTSANAKMEAGNDAAQTMIDAAYGHHSFERFRKRFLLMRRNKKK